MARADCGSQASLLLHRTSLVVAQQPAPADIGQRIVEITETLMPVDSRFLVAVYLNDDGPPILAHSKRGHDAELLAPGDTARIEAILRADRSRGIVATALRTGRGSFRETFASWLISWMCSNRSAPACALRRSATGAWWAR